MELIVISDDCSPDRQGDMQILDPSNFSVEPLLAKCPNLSVVPSRVVCPDVPDLLVQICAESRVEHLCRSTGRPELEGQLSVVTSQYRRLLSSCIVRGQAQCLISRVGVIAPQAREAAQRREVAGRIERALREERRAQWMASLRGPGWARRGRCHGIWWKMDFDAFIELDDLCLV